MHFKETKKIKTAGKSAGVWSCCFQVFFLEPLCSTGMSSLHLMVQVRSVQYCTAQTVLNNTCGFTHPPIPKLHLVFQPKSILASDTFYSETFSVP